VLSTCNLLNSVEGQSPENKLSIFGRAEKKLRVAEEINKTCKADLSVANSRTRQKYEKKLAKVSDELECCLEILNSLKSELYHDEQWKDTISQNVVSEQEVGNAIIENLNSIQSETKSSLNNTKKMVAASKDIGLATSAELNRQHQQLAINDDHAMRAEDNLTQSDKLIKTLNRLVKDRRIRCFAAINAMLLVGIVIFVIVNMLKESSTGKNGSTLPVRMLRRGHDT
jgi:hypothetical protein